MRFPHSVLVAVCIVLFPAGIAWSQGGGGGGGAGGAGSGAAGAGAAGAGGGRGGVGTSATSGGAAVGGGAPAGAVGGGAPAGAVGGGAPPTNSAMTPEAPGSDPASNAAAANSTAANPSSAGAVVGGSTGTGTQSGARSSRAPSQGGAPPVMGQTQTATDRPEVSGAADFPPATTTGLATTAADGVSTKVVPAKPCSTAARETDGTTTCVGIPSKRN
jgi:hypothetical protein